MSGSLSSVFERAEAEDLVQDVGDQRIALEQAERRRLALALEQAEDQAADLRLGILALDARSSRSRFSRPSSSW